MIKYEQQHIYINIYVNILCRYINKYKQRKMNIKKIRKYDSEPVKANTIKK